MNKTILVVAALWSLASMAAAQTVAEAAQKEKELRTAPKPGPVIVVTNADLAKVLKKSAVKLPEAKAAGGVGAPVEGAPAAVTATPPRDETAAAGAAAKAAAIPASVLEGNPRAVFDQKKAELEKTWATAKERIDLLSIKMIGLQQQLAGAIQPGAKDQIQAALVETSKARQSAQDAEKKAKEELDRFATNGNR